MATRFNFRSDIDVGFATNGPTTGEQSVALPIGTNVGGPTTAKRMLTTTGATTITESFLTLPQTARQSGYFGIFVSDPLAAQTISAQTWSAVIRRRESNAAVNAFFAASIYLWRPSTSTLVFPFIYDSSTSLGTEFPTTFATATYSLSGASVTCQTGDVLVIEPWWSAAQGMGTEYTVEIQYNAAGISYLESPQDLAFAKERTFGHIIY